MAKHLPSEFRGLASRVARIAGTSDRGAALAEVDRFSNALYVIDVFHAKIHQGTAFEHTLLVEGVNDTNTIALLFVIGQGINLHARIGAKGGGQGILRLYENPTVSDNGTAQTPRNRNRQFSDATAGTLFANPTVSDNGTLLTEALVPGSSGGFGFSAALGGASDLPEEWVFAADNTYLVELTNTSGNTRDFSIGVNAYEETVKGPTEGLGS